MSAKEYSAAFRNIATKLPDWPEGLLVDYYKEGLNMEILGKAIAHANPQSLVRWIQAAAEVEAQLRLIRSLKQLRAPSAPSSQPKPLPLHVGKKQVTQPKTDASSEQCFKSGCCLTCGGMGRFAAQCPLPAPAGDTPGQAKKLSSSPPQKLTSLKPTKKFAKSTLADLLGMARVDDMDPKDLRAAADPKPSGNK